MLPLSISVLTWSNRRMSGRRCSRFYMKVWFLSMLSSFRCFICISDLYLPLWRINIIVMPARKGYELCLKHFASSRMFFESIWMAIGSCYLCLVGSLECLRKCVCFVQKITLKFTLKITLTNWSQTEWHRQPTVFIYLLSVCASHHRGPTARPSAQNLIKGSLRFSSFAEIRRVLHHLFLRAINIALIVPIVATPPVCVSHMYTVWIRLTQAKITQAISIIL